MLLRRKRNAKYVIPAIRICSKLLNQIYKCICNPINGFSFDFFYNIVHCQQNFILCIH